VENLDGFQYFLHIWKRDECIAHCKYAIHIYFTSDVNMTPLSRTWHWWASCESVCCMRGKAWSSADWWRSWPMTNTCLRSCQWWAFWTYLVTVNLFYLYLMNFMFHTTLDALGNILRVYYKSMKCDVLFSQGSISTLFRWVEHVFHVCIKCSSCLQQYKNYKKSNEFLQSYDHKCTATFYESQRIV